MSKIAKIKTYDIANGKGIRTSIFFSGCEHYCKNCFNQELWDFNVGKQINLRMMDYINSTMNDHIKGISILGGEPMHPENICDLGALLSYFKSNNPTKDVWLWSGYTFEELMNRDDDFLNYITKYIFKSVDVLVDGRFIEEKKDLTLKFRGSSNQRVIDVQKSLAKGKVVVYEEKDN